MFTTKFRNWIKIIYAVDEFSTLNDLCRFHIHVLREHTKNQTKKKKLYSFRTNQKYLLFTVHTDILNIFLHFEPLPKTV